MKTSTHSDAKRDLHERHKAWLLELMRVTNLKLSPLATKAGVADSTLTRLVNDENYSGTLAATTIKKLCDRYQVPGPDTFRPGDRLDDVEATRLANHEAADILKAFHVDKEFQIWRLHGRPLDAAGYLRGDLLIVDPKRQPIAGDIVLAHLFIGSGDPQPIFRLFEPPYLVAASMTQDYRKPLLVDNDRVIVRGVVAASMRVAT